MTKKNLYIACATAVMIISAAGCGKKSDTAKSAEANARDTLRAVTLYGPTTYFDYRGQEMGYEYENVKRFASDEGMVLKLSVANNVASMLAKLDSGEADVAAYPVPRIDEYSDRILNCGANEVTHQVLVQPGGKDALTDVTQLIGKEIYVEKDSKYHYRLKNLDDELGGGIVIHAISRDTLISEDLIEMVHSGEIPFTVVDSDIAEINRSYYPDLDIGMQLSLDQAGSWAVGKDNTALAERINAWSASNNTTTYTKSLYRKYFELSKIPSSDGTDFAAGASVGRDGVISMFDAYFQMYSELCGYDWKMLAAICFAESRFNPAVESWAGAMGLMQIMPSTAQALGYTLQEAANPELNIKIGAILIGKLNESLKKRIKNPKERIKFVVASYNSGLGHISDAIALAEKYGLDPELWEGNVSEAVLWKSKPKYFNDPVVRNGYFRGRETVDFVDKVLTAYRIYTRED